MTRGINIDTIRLIIQQKDILKIKFKNTNEEIFFKCSIERQMEIIYLLLLFLKHTVDQIGQETNKEKNLNITYSKNNKRETENIKKMTENMKLVKNFR